MCILYIILPTVSSDDSSMLKKIHISSKISDHLLDGWALNEAELFFFHHHYVVDVRNFKF